MRDPFSIFSNFIPNGLQTRHFFLIGWFLKFFFFNTTKPNGTKLDRRHIVYGIYVLYNVSSFHSDRTNNIAAIGNSYFAYVWLKSLFSPKPLSQVKQSLTGDRERKVLYKTYLCRPDRTKTSWLPKVLLVSGCLFWTAPLYKLKFCWKHLSDFCYKVFSSRSGSWPQTLMN